MKPSDKIDFQNVGELTHRLSRRTITPKRFSLEIPSRDAANGIYAAYKAEVAQRSGELVLDADTRSHIAKAADWITDPDGKFGLMLMGVCGNGKTSLMRAIARLIGYVTETTLGYSRRKSVRVVTAREIARLCSSEDKETRKGYDELFGEPMLGIDDLGTEPREVTVYGRVTEPVDLLLSSRYDRQQFTIVTTNLNEKLLGEKYDTRVYDRLKEMMEIITFRNPSYRGK